MRCRIFNEFEIVDEIREKFRSNDIRIELDKITNCLLLEGSCDLVRRVDEYVKNCLQVTLIFAAYVNHWSILGYRFGDLNEILFPMRNSELW